MEEPERIRSKYGPWWAWLAGGFLTVWLLIFFTLRSDSAQDIMVLQNAKAVAIKNAASAASAITEPDWNNINTFGDRVYFDEVSDTAINVVNKPTYTTYTLRESLLFDNDKSIIKTSAVDMLMQIKNSLNKHYRDANIGLYGNTNSAPGKIYNRKLSNERAEAVKSWFRTNGMIQEYISIHSLDDQKPIASNELPIEKQQNHNLVIAVFPEKSQLIYKQ